MRGVRSGRFAVSLILAGAALALASPALAGPSAGLSQAFTAKKTIAVALPGDGDATLASIVLTGKVKRGRAGTLPLPKLRILKAGSLPGDVSVAGSAVKLKGKKNRFLLTLVLLNRQSTAPIRPVGAAPVPQVQVEVRFVAPGESFVREIGVDLKSAPDVLATGSVGLAAAICTRLSTNDVSSAAKWLQGALPTSAGVVLEIAPRVVCNKDAEARIQLELLVQPQTLPTAEYTGIFLPFDATEVSFQISRQASSGRALAAQANGFDIQLPGARQVTAFLSPAGFVCTIATRVTTNDTLSCAGIVAPGATYTGNIRMSPGPTAGMGGTLYVFAGGVQLGPFAITGPTPVPRTG